MLFFLKKKLRLLIGKRLTPHGLKTPFRCCALKAGDIARGPLAFPFCFSHQDRGNGNVASVSLSSKIPLWFSAFYVADRITLTVYKTPFSNLPSDMSGISYQESSKSMMGGTLPNNI